MPRHYPAELTCERILAGEAVKDLSAELGIHNVTLYKWRRQAPIDAGERPRVTRPIPTGRPAAGQRARTPRCRAALRSLRRGQAAPSRWRSPTWLASALGSDALFRQSMALSRHSPYTGRVELSPRRFCADVTRR